MSSTEAGRGGTVWDAPNQQTVRADQSAPWEEGDGGSEAAPEPPTLDEMTKAQLITYADAHGVTVDDSMTKAEIRAEIDAAAVN